MLKIGGCKTYFLNTHLEVCCCGCVGGQLWLLVVNCCSYIVSRYGNSFLQIYFHIYYILYYHYYNLKTMYLLLQFFCLAHHLMCWPDNSDNCFKPVEKPPVSFQCCRIDLLWILSSMKKDFSGSSSSCYERGIA